MLVGRKDQQARQKWRAAWRKARCLGTKDMPKHWLKRRNMMLYLAYLRLCRRSWGDPLAMPAPERLVQNKLVDEIIAELKAEGRW